MNGIAVTSEPDGELVTVPVLMGFDQSNVVGRLTLLKDKLPPGVGWMLSLGYEADKFERLPNDGIKILKYTLHCVSLATDAQYKAYLESDLYKRDNP